MKAKEEAKDLAQEMAELRYQMLEEECNRWACMNFPVRGTGIMPGFEGSYIPLEAPYPFITIFFQLTASSL